MNENFIKQKNFQTLTFYRKGIWKKYTEVSSISTFYWIKFCSENCSTNTPDTFERFARQIFTTWSKFFKNCPIWLWYLIQKNQSLNKIGQLFVKQVFIRILILFCTTLYFDLIKENWNFLTYAKMNFKTFSINYKIFLWNIPPID